MIKHLNRNKKIGVIGSGFAGLSASAMLGAAGYQVEVFEKNSQIGGRARHFNSQGFMFDMGPSWYWMPDVFERFYNKFGKTTADFYELKKLDPGFKVIYGMNESIDIPASFDELCSLFESIEKGSAVKLKSFLLDAEYKYNTGINDLVYKPSHSIREFMSLRLLKDVMRLQVFSSFSKHVRTYFKDPRLLALIEFPVLFLGAMPKDTPALYSLMNYAGLRQGTFYPMGGFATVIDAFKQLAEQEGVHIHTSSAVEALSMNGNKIRSLQTKHGVSEIQAVIAAADYHHVESKLIPPAFKTYDEAYWDKKTFAPSSLIFYLGVNKKLNKLAHHNLFFDEDFGLHSEEIYKSKKWPSKPLFYACCPAKTDPAVAPENCENLFILMPIAVGLSDSEDNTDYYYQIIMKRLEAFAGENISQHIIFKQSYSVNNFKEDYNAYKGNAYGLANTLMQTAIFKPKMKSRKISNLFFAGQLTVPGPGVPPSIISGQVAANELIKYMNR